MGIRIINPNGQTTEVLPFAKHKGNIADHLYNAVAVNYSNTEMIVLIAFAGQMIATNIFNNVIETDIDEYLDEYKSPLKN